MPGATHEGLEGKKNTIDRSSLFFTEEKSKNLTCIWIITGQTHLGIKHFLKS